MPQILQAPPGLATSPAPPLPAQRDSLSSQAWTNLKSPMRNGGHSEVLDTLEALHAKREKLLAEKGGCNQQMKGLHTHQSQTSNDKEKLKQIKAEQRIKEGEIKEVASNLASLVDGMQLCPDVFECVATTPQSYRAILLDL